MYDFVPMPNSLKIRNQAFYTGIRLLFEISNNQGYVESLKREIDESSPLAAFFILDDIEHLEMIIETKNKERDRVDDIRRHYDVARIRRHRRRY